MRIALFHDLPSGGAKRSVFEVARRLAKRHTLEVYSLSRAEHTFGDLHPFVPGYHLAEFEPSRLFQSPLGRLNQFQRWRDLQRLEWVGRALAQQIDAGHYAVVWVHPSMWTQAPYVLRFLRTPSVYYVHEVLRQAYEPAIERPYTSGSRWRTALNRIDPLIRLYEQTLRQVDRRNTLSATRLLTNSNFTAENIRQAYGASATVCYLGVDAELFQPDPAVPSGGFVLSVGALRPNKGFDFLIQALATLPQSERPPLRIIANASDGLEHNYLKELAGRSQVSLTIEIGVGDAALVQAYQQALLVAYAPIREPFGFVPLEAMACARPVLAVREGGVAETIQNGETGCLTERDSQSFGRSLLDLIHQRDRAEQLGRQGRECVTQQWTWGAAVDRIEAQLAAAVHGSPSTS